VEDSDVGLSFVGFESRETVEANGKDPHFQKGLGPLAEILEELPTELHAYDVNLARLTTRFGETP
jgi:hypothetical protein